MLSHRTRFKCTKRPIHTAKLSLRIYLRISFCHLTSFSNCYHSYQHLFQTPPLLNVMFGCVFQGAFWGMIVGFIVGAIRMILDFTHLEPRCGEEDTRPSIIAKVHYMYFALILFWITVITIVVISLFTEQQKDGNVSQIHSCILFFCIYCFLMGKRNFEVTVPIDLFRKWLPL